MNNELSRWKRLLAIAWPLIVANSFWNLQMTIDRIFLGTYSTEALGAAMAVMGVFWVPMALLQQTASYVTTFVAQYFGSKEYEKIGPSVWQALHVSVIGGLLFLLLNYVSGWFFGLVGHPASIQALEVSYYNSIAFSALPTALVAAVSGFYTGLGKTQMVMAINFVGLVLNVLFDYILIFGNWGFPELGIQGAGYATALSAAGASIFGLLIMFNKTNEAKYRIFSGWKLRLQLVRQFLKYGLPSGMQWALEGMAFTVFLIIMGRLPNGEAALASSSIAVTLMMLAVLPCIGMGQAVMTKVGQHIGEKTPKRAISVAWDGVKISSLYIFAVSLTLLFFPEFYLSWFENKSDSALWQQVTLITPVLLKIVAVFTLFDSVYLVISFALKGAGDTNFVSLVALITPWPTMVLPTFLVMDFENAVVIAWSFSILYSLLISTIMAIRFKQGKWMSMSVTNIQETR